MNKQQFELKKSAWFYLEALTRNAQPPDGAGRAHLFAYVCALESELDARREAMCVVPRVEGPGPGPQVNEIPLKVQLIPAGIQARPGLVGELVG